MADNENFRKPARPRSRSTSTSRSRSRSTSVSSVIKSTESIASSGQSTGSTWSFHPGPSGRLYVKYETTEDVCTKTKGDPLAQKEAVYSTERDKVVQQDQFLVTPLHVLKDMAYQNNKKLIIENITVPDARGPGRSIHRVDIMLEGTRGFGQSPTRQMARQLAAIDVLEKLELSGELQKMEAPVTTSALIPGWRISSTIFDRLRRALKPEDRGKLTYTVEPPPENKLGQFTVTCRFGDLQTEAKSDLPSMAKKLAAKEMYERLTKKEFFPVHTITADDPLGFKTLRHMGYEPKITGAKRQWLNDYPNGYSNLEPDDGDDEQVEDPKRCKVDTPTVVEPANSRSVVEPATSRIVGQSVRLLPRGRGRGMQLRASLSQTIPAALTPSQVEANLSVSRTFVESAASRTVVEPANLRIVVEPSTSRTVVQPSPSSTVVESATFRIPVEPSTSTTVVEPAASTNVVEPATVEQPVILLSRGRGKGTQLRSTLTQTQSAALSPSQVELSPPAIRTVQEVEDRNFLITVKPGEVADAVVDQPVKEKSVFDKVNVTTPTFFVKEEPMDLDPKYENFQVSLNYNFESDDPQASYFPDDFDDEPDDPRACYLPDDFDDDMPDVPLPSPGDRFFS